MYEKKTQPALSIKLTQRQVTLVVSIWSSFAQARTCNCFQFLCGHDFVFHVLTSLTKNALNNWNPNGNPFRAKCVNPARTFRVNCLDFHLNPAAVTEPCSERTASVWCSNPRVSILCLSPNKKGFSISDRKE